MGYFIFIQKSTIQKYFMPVVADELLGNALIETRYLVERATLLPADWKAC